MFDELVCHIGKNEHRPFICLVSMTCVAHFPHLCLPNFLSLPSCLTASDLILMIAWSSYNRNYLSSVLIQEIFLTWDHDDLSMRAKVSIVLLLAWIFILWYSIVDIFQLRCTSGRPAHWQLDPFFWCTCRQLEFWWSYFASMNLTCVTKRLKISSTLPSYTFLLLAR